MPAITDILQGEMISSICRGAFAAGCDVAVLTNTTNAHDEFVYNEYTVGEENIFTLIGNARLDGIIYASHYFRKTAVRNKISDIIKSAGIPCVDTGFGSEFETVHVPQKQAMYDITEHVITVHGCKRLCCLTGQKDIPESVERLEGVLDAAHRHGINDVDIVYGDFWKSKAESLGMAILSGEMPKPDAVICASDVMAVSLCDTLIEGGMSVPEDIIITGYDAHIVALSHFPSITTVSGQSRETGRLATEKLLAMIGAAEFGDKKIQLKTEFGASCGCRSLHDDYKQAALQIQTYISNEYRKTEMLEMQTNTSYIAEMAEAQSLDELVSAIDRTAHIITDFRSIDICLCSDWAGNLKKPDIYRNEGYPDTMYLALSKRIDRRCGSGYEFPTEELIPAMNEPHEPQLFMVTPIHHILRAYGYCVISYDRGHHFQISPLLKSWLDAISNGLRTLQKKMYTDYLQSKVDEASLHDMMTDLLSKKGLLRRMNEAALNGRPHGLVLMTVGRILASDLSSAPDNFMDTVINSEMIIANALQLISGGESAAARLNERTFAFMFSLLDGQTLEAVTEQTITRLDIFIKKIQESAIYAYLPEIVHNSFIITDTSKEFLNARIKELESMAAGAVKKSYDTTQLERLRREIHLATQLDWSLTSAAQRLNISTSYLQKLYKKQFGMTYIDDVIGSRIEKAKYLLSATDLRISEVAEQCGYQNPTHFMRQFKEKAGATPSEYRSGRK